MTRRRWVKRTSDAERRAELASYRDARRHARATIPPRSEWTYKAGDPRPRHKNGLLIAGLLPQTPWKKLKARVLGAKDKPADKPKRHGGPRWTLLRANVSRSKHSGRFVSRKVGRSS